LVVNFFLFKYGSLAFTDRSEPNFSYSSITAKYVFHK